MVWTLGFLPVVLLACGFPVFLVLLTAAAVTLMLFMNMPMVVLQQTLFASINVYALLALPFFIFAGELMDRGGIAVRLTDLVRASMGRVPGKLPLTAVGAGAVFGAITGVGAASVATVGKVMHPAMTKAGYDESFTAGLLVSVGAVGAVLPPSIPMIIYAAAADESIPKLYAAGIGPGLLIVALLAAYCMWTSRRSRTDTGVRFEFSTFLRALGRGIWALGVPAVILGGIYGGVFSPTEAASIACLYALFVTVLVLRDLDLAGVLAAARNTVAFTAQVLLIVACAGVFSWVLTVNQVPAAMVAWFDTLNAPGWVLLLSINALLLMIGCVLDPLSAILLLTPLFLPLISAAGIDPVQFGMVVTVNLAIGLFTPPFGINIFVVQSLFQTRLAAIYRGTVPFFLLYLLALLMVTFVPQISQFGQWLLL